MLYEELLKNGKVLPGISDVVFKKIMISHKDYLGLILEKIIPVSKEDIIEKGEFLNIEIPPSNLSLKNGRMDLLLRVGKYYIDLEANSIINDSLLIRNEAHFGGLIFNEYARRDKKTLEEILCQVSFNKKKRLSNELIVRLQYWDRKLNVGDERILKVELNLEFVNQKYYNKEEMTTFEKALMLLVIEDEKELIEFMKGDSILESVGNDIISYSRAKEIVTAYENAMIEENYRNNRAREEGHDEGFQKGRNEGLEQGIEQGIEQGSKEKQLEIAQLMLNKNMNIKLISEITGLSIMEIEKFQ